MPRALNLQKLPEESGRGVISSAPGACVPQPKPLSVSDRTARDEAQDSGRITAAARRI